MSFQYWRVVERKQTATTPFLCYFLPTSTIISFQISNILFPFFSFVSLSQTLPKGLQLKFSGIFSSRLHYRHVVSFKHHITHPRAGACPVNYTEAYRNNDADDLCADASADLPNDAWAWFFSFYFWPFPCNHCKGKQASVHGNLLIYWFLLCIVFLLLHSFSNYILVFLFIHIVYNCNFNFYASICNWSFFNISNILTCSFNFFCNAIISFCIGLCQAYQIWRMK